MKQIKTFLLLSLIVFFVSCSGIIKSNEKQQQSDKQSLVGEFIAQSKNITGDQVVLEIVLITQNGVYSLDIADYTSAYIITMAGDQSVFHRTNAVLGGDGKWVYTQGVCAAPMGVDFSGIGNPCQDFSNVLNILKTHHINISSSFIDLSKALVMPVLKHGYYGTSYDGDGGGFVSVDSVTGKLEITPLITSVNN